MRRSAFNERAIPLSAILLGQGHHIAHRIHTRRPPCFGKHQRCSQGVRVLTIGHHGGEHRRQIDQFCRKMRIHARAGRIAVAPGISDFDRAKHSFQPLLPEARIGNFEQNASARQFAFRSGQSLRNGRRSDQKGLRHLSRSHPAHSCQRQRYAVGQIDRRMAAGENQRQSMVGNGVQSHLNCAFANAVACRITSHAKLPCAIDYDSGSHAVKPCCPVLDRLGSLCRPQAGFGKSLFRQIEIAAMFGERCNQLQTLARDNRGQ